MPPLLAARRANRMNSPTIRSVGPKPSSTETISGVVVVVDCALTWTPSDLSSAASWLLFQKLGTWVANRVVGVVLLSADG